MDKKRQDEHPKKTSVRSSSVVTKSQLDPLFAKEELETAMTDEDLTNHVDALDYMDKKRQIEHPKKTSVRASATVTKGQLDPLLVKEELETTASEETVEDLTNHVDALAYMDKKRQEEHPKKTSVRASSTVTKGQLDPLLAKEELDITASEATVDELTNHVDALAYMDKKRQNEHPKKTSFRASATVTKGQLDPLLAKEELETAVTEETIEDLTDHVDALTYMDKKRHDGHPKKTSVRSSSMVTKGQLDPLFPKEELGTGGSEQTGFDMISVIPDSMTAGSSTGSTTERRQNRELVDSNNESRASSAEDDDASSIVEDDDKAIGAPEETSGRVTEEFLMSHTWTQADFKVVGDFSTNHDETLEMNQGE
jgi:predicted nucleic acid-binding protein